MATQEAMLASWSIFEMISSEPAGKDKAQLRFLKSCVVDEPSTVSLLVIAVSEEYS